MQIETKHGVRMSNATTIYSADLAGALPRLARVEQQARPGACAKPCGKRGCSKALPELVPVEEPKTEANAPALSERLGIDLNTTALQEEATDFRLREEARNPVARLTVYSLNAILLFLAFPVGFALLIFNILGGENLRTTSHALALTGLGIALTATDAGQRLFNLM